MSREMKFRAYNHVSKEIYLETKLGDVFKWENEGQIQTIMQYTGLKDKNGVEIYEGDVCRILYTDWSSNTNLEIGLEDYKKSISMVGRIEYLAPEFSILLRDRYGDFSQNSMRYGKHGEIEVIGNIHQNPELS